MPHRNTNWMTWTHLWHCLWGFVFMRWWNYSTLSHPWCREPKTFSVWSELYCSFHSFLSQIRVTADVKSLFANVNTTGHILQRQIFVTHGALKAVRVPLVLPRAEHISSNCKVAVQVQWNSYHHVTEAEQPKLNSNASLQSQPQQKSERKATPWSAGNKMLSKKAFTVQMPIQKWQSALAACSLARQTHQSQKAFPH